MQRARYRLYICFMEASKEILCYKFHEKCQVHLGLGILIRIKGGPLMQQLEVR